MADPLPSHEIERHQTHVGREISETDVIETHDVARMAATLGLHADTVELPPLWHYGLFLTPVATARLGPDGHPPRGEFMPPVILPRRMFAGSDIAFLHPLSVGQPVTRISRIASVDHRSGKTGDLVFVRVAMTLSQSGAPCLEEEQTIVYRAAGGRTPAVEPRPLPPVEPGDRTEAWLPTTVELFRYSSSTFNSHRIHYDLPYAMEEEGYPGLVVHGPLTATKLCAFATAIADRPPRRFKFRGEAPLFAGQPVRLVGRMEGTTCTVRAERADGATAMSATATFG